MAKSSYTLQEKLDKKVLIEAKKLVRNHGFVVSHSIEALDELNELMSEDGLKIIVELIGNGPDRYVQIYKDGKVSAETKVYTVGDEIYAD